MAEIPSERNGRLKLDPMVAMQIVAWIAAALLTYGAVNARVSVVETQMQQFRDDLHEVKTDVKELLRQTR